MSYTEDQGSYAEGLADAAAAGEVSYMVADLTKRAKSVRDQITSIESTAGQVASSELRAAATKRIAELRIMLYQIVAAATHEMYSAQDVQAWVEHGLSRGGDFPTVDGKVIKDMAFIRRVPNAPIREAFLDAMEDGRVSQEQIVSTAHERLAELEDEGATDLEVSAWSCSDTESAKRATESVRTQLGMNVRRNSRGVVSCAMLIPYERAVALSRAIGLNPQEAGV